MAGIRQYYDGKHTFFLDGLSVPDFTICDLVSGGEVSVRDIYSRNKLTMLLAWNPLQEESVRFMETTVKRLYTLFHTQGFDVIAVTPEGDAYRTAAQVYVQEHDVPWYVCTDYHDADGETVRIAFRPLSQLFALQARRGACGRHVCGRSGSSLFRIARLNGKRSKICCLFSMRVS